MPSPSRSFLEKHYDRLSLEADSPIGFAKRGLSVLLRARNTRIQIKRCIEFFCTFCSCAVGVRGDNSEAPEKSHRCLQRHRQRSSVRQPPQSPQSRYRATMLNRMMPRMPLLSLRSSNRMTHYPLCSSTVGGRGDQNLLGFNGTDAAVLYAAAAAVAAIAEFGEITTPNAGSC